MENYKEVNYTLWTKLVGWLSFLFALTMIGCTSAPATGSDTTELPLDTPILTKPATDPIALVANQDQVGQDCILIQKGRVTGQAFWERTGELAGDGQIVSLILDAGPTLSQRLQDGSYSFPMLARQCGDEVEWIGFSVRYGRGSEYVKPETEQVYLNVYSTGSGSDTPADTKECTLMLGDIRGRIMSDAKPVPDGTIVMATLGPAPVTAERALQRVTTRDGYYTITSIGNRCGDKAFWLEWSLSALGEQISLTPTTDQTTQDMVISPSS